MIQLNEQISYLHNLLIILTSKRHSSFQDAVIELKAVLIDQKKSEYLPENTYAEAQAHHISAFEFNLAFEKSRMELADALIRLQVIPSLALALVSTYSSGNLEYLKSAIKSSYTVDLDRVERECRPESFRIFSHIHKVVLHYLIIQFGHNVHSALAIVETFTFRNLETFAWIITFQLPSILKIASQIMKDYNATLPHALEQMVKIIENSNTTKDPYIKQIQAAKLMLADFSTLFPKSFDSAHRVMAYYNSQPLNNTNPEIFEIETISLKYLAQLGWEKADAQALYNKLTPQQVRDLPDATHGPISAYRNAMQHLLGMMTFDEAHQEVIRVIHDHTSYPKFQIPFDDNNYAYEIKTTGLAMWHLELLISERINFEIYTARLSLDNLHKQVETRRKMDEIAKINIDNEYRLNREAFLTEMGSLLEVKLGYTNTSAPERARQLPEDRLAELPNAIENIVILKNVTSQAMYLYDMTLDNTLNMMWQIATNRFDPSKNILFYTNVATKVTLKDWYFDLLSDNARAEMEIVANTLATSSTKLDAPHLVTHQFGQAVAAKSKEIRAASYQEAVDALVNIGFKTDIALDMVNSKLNENEVLRLVYFIKLKVPVIKEVMKTIITIDPTLQTYEAAHEQLEKIIASRYDSLGERMAYELITMEYAIKKWQLTLIPTKAREQLFQEAAANAKDYQAMMSKMMVNISQVKFNRSHNLWPTKTTNNLYSDWLASLPTASANMSLSNSTEYLDSTADSTGPVKMPYTTSYNLGDLSKISPSIWLNGGITVAFFVVAGYLLAAMPNCARRFFRRNKSPTPSNAANTAEKRRLLFSRRPRQHTEV